MWRCENLIDNQFSHPQIFTLLKSLLNGKTGILLSLQTRRGFLYSPAVQQEVTCCMLLLRKELPAISHVQEFDSPSRWHRDSSVVE